MVTTHVGCGLEFSTSFKKHKLWGKCLRHQDRATSEWHSFWLDRKLWFVLCSLLTGGTDGGGAAWGWKEQRPDPRGRGKISEWGATQEVLKSPFRSLTQMFSHNFRGMCLAAPKAVTRPYLPKSTELRGDKVGTVSLKCLCLVEKRVSRWDQTTRYSGLAPCSCLTATASVRAVSWFWGQRGYKVWPRPVIADKAVWIDRLSGRGGREIAIVVSVTPEHIVCSMFAVLRKDRKQKKNPFPYRELVES